MLHPITMAPEKLRIYRPISHFGRAIDILGKQISARLLCLAHHRHRDIGRHRISGIAIYRI